MAQLFPVPPKKKVKKNRKPPIAGPPKDVLTAGDTADNPFAKKGPPIGRKVPPAPKKKSAPKPKAAKASGPSGVLGPPQIGSFGSPKSAPPAPKKASAPKPPLGSGQRFAQLSSQLSKKPGVTNPGALAASIGRKSLGKSKFQSLAAKGKPGY